jgi:hypothetical protein
MGGISYTMGKQVVAVALVVLTSSSAAAGYVQAVEKPPLSGANITGEVLVGGLGGIAGGCVGVVVGSELVYQLVTGKTPYEFGGMLYGIGGFYIGYPLGSVTGVYLVGSIGDKSGSFLAALGGGCIGGLVGAIGLEWALRTDCAWYKIFPALLAAPIAATIAFNLTRKYQSSADSDGGKHNLAPAIYLNLLRMKF